ncbi:MAG: hypothetical protein DHS20C16_08230 [Phycisphaerae bacterium]|nr:MAG: hypothetical protein DHS20C16_08230 [Phycisphaerae bacterium]
MAKQSVGPIVRHIDKAILGVTGALLLLAIAQYGVVSPNKIESDGEWLGPAQVDNATREKADALRDRLRRAETPAEPFEDPMNRVSELVDPLAAAGVEGEIPRMLSFPPQVPKVEGSIMTPGKRHDLITVVKLDRPTTQAGRTGAYVNPPETLGNAQNKGKEAASLRDVNWVTVSASFPRQQQEAMADAAGYNPERVNTLFTGVDVERRTLNADGSFSDWQPIKTVAHQVLPPLPEPEVYKVEDGKGFNVSPEDRDEIKEFKNLIAMPESQLTLMRPLFLEREYGDEWYYPRGQFSQEVTEMDAEYSSGDGTCRYPECKTTDVDKDLEFNDLIKDAEAQLDKGKLAQARKLMEQAEKKADDRDQRKVDKLKKKIEIAEQKTPVNPARSASQVLWAHDAAPGSVESGRTYQYRIRPRIYNQYCGTPPLLNNPEDAAKVELVGDWSEPSEPVTVDRDTIFFVRSGNAKKQNCKVDLFKWVAGKWIQKQFTLAVGAPIGEEVKRIKTHRGDDDQVDFSTGATVVDIDYEKPYWPKGRRNNRSKQATKTTALVYVDASGHVFEQTEEFDENSDLYDEYKEIAWDDKRR